MRVPRGEELARAIAEQPPAERDRFVDELLGLDGRPAVDDACVGDDPELIRCVASGVSAVADAVLKAGVGPGDLFLDVGAGCGRVAMLAHLLTGARAMGLEIQPTLVAFGRDRADRLGLEGVELRVGDARRDALPDATVVYLYLPFVGRSLSMVLARLRDMARRAPLIVCALGVELRHERWLRALDESSLWMTVHQSVESGPPPPRRPPALPSLTWVAEERRRIVED